MRGDCEGEPHVHPARVPLHGSVDELLDAGELDDLGELALDLAPPHSEHGAVQEDILPPGQFGVESGPDLEEAAHAPADLRASLGRCGDTRQQLQQGRLPRSVTSDDSDHLAGGHVERDVAKRPDVLMVMLMVQSPGETAGAAGQRLAQRAVTRLQLADPVTLREPLG